MKKILLFSVLIMSALFAVSCSKAGDNEDTPIVTDESWLKTNFKGDWNLYQMKGSDGKLIQFAAGIPTYTFNADGTLKITDGVLGDDGSNETWRISGDYFILNRGIEDLKYIIGDVDRTNFTVVILKYGIFKKK